MTDAAVARLSESTRPVIGIRAVSSHNARWRADIPPRSQPIINTPGFGTRTRRMSRLARAEVPTTRARTRFFQAASLRQSVRTIGTVKTAPIEARTTAGSNGSTLRSRTRRRRRRMPQRCELRIRDCRANAPRRSTRAAHADSDYAEGRRRRGARPRRRRWVPPNAKRTRTPSSVDAESVRGSGPRALRVSVSGDAPSRARARRRSRAWSRQRSRIDRLRRRSYLFVRARRSSRAWRWCRENAPPSGARVENLQVRSSERHRAPGYAAGSKVQAQSTSTERCVSWCSTSRPSNPTEITVHFFTVPSISLVTARVPRSERSSTFTRPT